MPTVAELFDQLIDQLADDVAGKVMPKVDERIAEAMAKPDQPAPEPEQPTEPAPEPEQPELPIAAQFKFVNETGGEWVNGVSDNRGMFRLVYSGGMEDEVKPGMMATFKDGTKRRITESRPAWGNLLVSVEGGKISPTLGHPNAVTVSQGDGEADQEGELLAPEAQPEPSKPVTNKGRVFLNLGLGMGGDTIAGGLPGKHGQHYNFPNLDEWKQAAAQGFKRARVGFLWERAIRGGAGSGQLDEAHMQLMDQTASYAAQVGMTILWDMHNYSGYSTTNKSGDRKRIGAGVSVEALGNDWKAIAQRLESNATTKAATYGYDLMNEPIISWDVWRQALQHAVTQVGNISDKVISCEGIKYSNTTNWVSNNPGIENIVHPKGKQYLEFQGHLYLDNGQDGFWTDSVETANKADPNIGVNRIKGFREWGAKHGYHLSIGETMVPGRYASYVTALDKFLEHNVNNGIDTYVFFAARGAGNNDHNINKPENKPSLDVILKWVNA
ncbi:MAG TPA: hypothetical protein DHV63_13100 [Pseudomonas sp.]|nr:hypothetical protein [Pseudomonas sp.]